MLTARTIVQVGAVALLSAWAAGCVSSAPSDGGTPIAARPRGVEGDWLSSDGIAVSKLSGGVFTTSALDTGNKLADGSYKVAGNTVAITVVSLIRNTTTNVNCALVAQSQLNCTSSTGQQFVLTRRGSV